LALILASVSCLALVLGCSLPGRVLGEVPGSTAAPDVPEVESTPPAGDTPAADSMIVTHQAPDFKVYSLEGKLVETRSAEGLAYARPNTAQVVGDSIYYVDSGGSSLGGVVRRVTADGVETLDFTSAEPQTSLTFAVSDDDQRIAWTLSSFDSAGVSSQLWIADLDGGNSQMIVESDPADSLAEYFALEAMRWMDDGDLIYAWQVTGIGGYILYFGWSSLYRYNPADGASTPLVAATADSSLPCWYGLSPDGAYAVTGCGPEGMLERQLATSTDTVFPVMPDQGQQGAAAYSPSGARLAYAIARGNPDDEAGQVLMRLQRGEAPTSIASQSPGYFDRILWADEDRMVVGYFLSEGGSVDLLNVDGTRSAIGGGALIGLMRPPATTAAAGLAE
jgi:hypothetical protein